MSRWMIPLAWAASGASAISIARLRSTSVSNGFARNAVLQRHALEKLHNDEGVPVLLTDVVNRADVGMIQGRSSLSLALESGERLRIAGNFIGQELESYEAMQPRVLGLVNAHPATAKPFDSAVVRDGLINHSVMPAPVATSYGHGNDSSTKAVPARQSRLATESGPNRHCNSRLSLAHDMSG